MAQRGSISRRTTDGTSGAAALELIAHSAGNGINVREFSVYLAAATASTYGLGRPAAKGITPTTPVQLLADDSISTSANMATTTAVAWGTGPTAPTQFYRRISFPNVIGSYVTWTFQNGLFVPAGGSLVLWNLALNGVVDVNITVDE